MYEGKREIRVVNISLSPYRLRIVEYICTNLYNPVHFSVVLVSEWRAESWKLSDYIRALAINRAHFALESI